jgi:FkbM family methyltransferase
VAELLIDHLKRFSGATNVLQNLMTHEASQKNRLGPLLRFVGWQLLKRTRNEPIDIEAFEGGKLRCYPDNSATNAVIYFGLSDWLEMSLLRDLLRPGDTFLDIGANVGVYSVLASTLVGPEGRVIAFEPDPTNASRLRHNFSLNGLDSDDIHQCALGETIGTCRFSTGNDAVGSVVIDEAAAGVEMPCERLDGKVSVSVQPAVAKMDVEGFELDVLKGAVDLLKAQMPKVWLLETNDCCERYGKTRLELQHHLDEFGYSLFEIQSGGSRLAQIPMGGPYPLNSVALCDRDWVRERVPRLDIRG